MSRYTREQLREMARTALAAKDAGDPRWAQLVMSLVMAMLLQPVEIEARIRDLAK